VTIETTIRMAGAVAAAVKPEAGQNIPHRTGRLWNLSVELPDRGSREIR